MKKIILAATTDLSYDQRMQRAAATLSAAGYEVLLIGRKKKSSIPIPESWTFETLRLQCIFEKGKLFYLEFNIRLLLRLLVLKADIIICADLDTMPAGSLNKLIKGCKLIFDAHEHFTEVPELADRPVAKTIWEKIGRYTIPTANVCYTVGERLADLLSTKYNRKFGYIRNMPIISTVPKHLYDSNNPYFIYTGAINEGRGIELLLEIFERLPYKLILAGDGDLMQQMKTLQETKYPNAKVEFTGFLIPDALRVLTAGAVAGFNLLELKSLSYRYSLANKFFDYVMAGIPQICIKLPEYEALNIEYEVALLSQYDADEVEQMTRLLLNDPHNYHRLKKNCEAAAKVWNWENEQQKLLQVIAEV